MRWAFEQKLLALLLAHPARSLLIASTVHPKVGADHKCRARSFILQVFKSVAGLGEQWPAVMEGLSGALAAMCVHGRLLCSEVLSFGHRCIGFVVSINVYI